MAQSTKKRSAKKTALIITAAIALVGIVVVGYRYYNRPVKTWNPESFENRNPDQILAKSSGMKYWEAKTPGDGFLITDSTMMAGDAKVYCVSGGVTSESADFKFGNDTSSAKNGYFTFCSQITLSDNRQVTFTLRDGQLQVFRVDRKR